MPGCAEAGGRFVDTASNYTDGSSEEIVGGCIASDRDPFVVPIVGARREEQLVENSAPWRPSSTRTTSSGWTRRDVQSSVSPSSSREASAA